MALPRGWQALRGLLLPALALVVGCPSTDGTASRPAGGGTVAGGAAAPGTRFEEAADSPVRPLRRCFPELPTWTDPLVGELLDRATAYQESQDFEGVLACAEEAARQAPRSVEAHHNRALGLLRLGRFTQARDAIALALALAPDDGESLELAAELFINRLSPSAERTTIGLEYARRGRRTPIGRRGVRAARLALLEGQALVDLGRSAEALTPLSVAQRYRPTEISARYERGVALFELCRMEEAEAAFLEVLSRQENHAHSLYHLALIEERRGDFVLSKTHFEKATRLDPRAFPRPPGIDPESFAELVERVTDRLAADVLADLTEIPVETADLPAIEDLTAERPPLSPTILGLFRGLPLGREQDEAEEEVTVAPVRGARGRQGRYSFAPASLEAGGSTGTVPNRAIVLYRRNILRSIRSLDELDAAIERTLLHEVGHLRGEDDGSLRDRGLE